MNDRESWSIRVRLTDAELSSVVNNMRRFCPSIGTDYFDAHIAKTIRATEDAIATKLAKETP